MSPNIFTDNDSRSILLTAELERVQRDRIEKELQLIKAKKENDWHETHMFGVRSAILFAFIMPMLCAVLDFVASLQLHAAVRTASGYDSVIWMCAIGISTMIGFAFKKYKDEKNTASSDPDALSPNTSARPGAPDAIAPAPRTAADAGTPSNQTGGDPAAKQEETGSIIDISPSKIFDKSPN